jgi:hypothetical protein
VERKHRSFDLFAAAVAVGVLFICFSSLAYGLMISGKLEFLQGFWRFQVHRVGCGYFLVLFGIVFVS